MKKIIVNGPNETIYEYKTKNGLIVYIWPNKISNEVSLTLTVRYGSIHTKFKVNNVEYEVPNGTAHFLEHIKFNEEDGKTAHDYFYTHGSYVNAYTTYDHTSYEVTCNKDVVDNLNHLLFFVYNNYFTKQLIEKEKPIIIEESKMVLDNPYNLGYQALSENLYINSNRKNLITGKPDDIKKINKDHILSVFNNYYHPQNMFLTVCGNVNMDEIINTVDEFMLSNDFGEYHNPQWIKNNEPLRVKKVNDQISVNVAMSKVMLSIKLPISNFIDFEKLNTNILLRILLEMNFGSTSEFNEYLLNKDLKDELIHYVSYEEDDVIINFEISSKYPSKVLDLVLNKFKNMDIDKADFQRKIKAIIASTILGFEDVNEVSSVIRNNCIRYNRIIDDYPDVFKALKIEDLENIKSCLNDYVYTSMILNPKSK